MKKNIFLIIGVIVLVALVGAGGFWGGMVYKTNQNAESQARFFEQRGEFPGSRQSVNGGQFPEGTPFPGSGPGSFEQPQGNFRGGGTIGQVKSIEKNVLTLSTAQDVTTVNLSDSTTILKSVEALPGDLQPGMQVMVIGERDDKGNITAIQITIVNNNALALPTRTAP